jgi:hypothetical protein
MSRLLTLAVLGISAFSLANPQESQAQVPVGVQVQVGPGVISYQQGYPYVAPRYVVPVAPVVVAPAPPIVVTTPVYVGWRWDGHRWYRNEHWDHRGHRR